MSKYIAFMWSQPDPDSSESTPRVLETFRRFARDWNCIVDVQGLVLYVNQTDCMMLRQTILPNDCGALLGTVFENRSSYENPESSSELLSDRAVNRIVASKGKCLADEYWGGFIALLIDRERACHYVFRDCSGNVPCYRLTCGNTNIIASDADDFRYLEVPPFTINWPYVAAFLFFDDLRVRNTGIEQITEVLAGEHVTLNGRQIYHHSLWDPRNICRQGLIDDMGSALCELRNSTRVVIEAWASEHPELLLNLSGGFDSAVVLGHLCKMTSKPRVTCINRYSQLPGEDERDFARAAARMAGVELVELEWGAAKIILDGNSMVARTAKPNVQSLAVFDAVRHNAVARRLNAHVTWTGHGGDHLFFQNRTSVIAADYLRSHGPGIGFARAVGAASRRTSESYWAVLRSAIADRLSRREWSPESATEGQIPFVEHDALPKDAENYIKHPWLADMADLPIGKQIQIRGLADLVNQPHSSYSLNLAPEHHPLISQPLIEACLRIPTYLLQHDGRDRALARDAFQNIVPQEIFQRQTKGSARSMAVNLIRQNQEAIRECLLDGELVRHGLLKRKSLEMYVSRGYPLRSTQLFPLLACIAAELWARSWMQQSARIAA